jgi:thiol-disulfide isomerase/thioredoxin
MLIFLLSFFIATAKAEIPSEITAKDLFKGSPTSFATHFADKKALVVVFMSARCPCSNSHFPVLAKLADKYKDIRFLAVHANADEPVKEAQSYFKLVSLPFPVLEDEHAKVADQFKALKTPHVFVLSPDGKILYQGGVTNSSMAEQSDRNYLNEALEDILKGQKVRTAEGRTLGCVIAREGENKNVW